MSLKSGDWVICKRAPNTAHQAFEGSVRQVGYLQMESVKFGKHFHLVPPTVSGDVHLLWTERYLRKLDDPGESAIDDSLLTVRIPEVDCA